MIKNKGARLRDRTNWQPSAHLIVQGGGALLGPPVALRGRLQAHPHWRVCLHEMPAAEDDRVVQMDFTLQNEAFNMLSENISLYRAEL